jgi:hypothetical protein
MMTVQELTASTATRVALGAAVVGVVLCGWTLTRAIRLDAVGTAPATVSVVPGALDLPPAAPAINVAAAVAADLFSIDRIAPEQRYRMPGEETAGTDAEPARPVVLGTAIAADGSSFATCQLESSRLQMVRVGDHLGDYTVKSISRDRVVFLTRAGTSLEILVPKQGS